MTNRERIARKIAQDVADGEFINLGHGIPYLVGAHIDPARTVFIQNEAGVVCLGCGTPAPAGEYSLRDSTNAYVGALPGAAFFDSAFSFGMIRGGHLDRTVLGALQVDQQGNIANWMVPGMPPTGIGGAMDLCVGCPNVHIAMESTTRDGGLRILKKCSYPLTAVAAATKVYTEFGVLALAPGEGFTLTEIFPDYTVEEIRKKMEPDFRVAKGLSTIELGTRPIQAHPQKGREK